MNEPAFPIYASDKVAFTGISIRDYFAAKAMPYLISNPDTIETEYLKAHGGLEETHDKWVATRAYEIADAMLKAREKGREGK